MGKKINGPIGPRQRALGAAISGALCCDLNDDERVFDGMDGGGHYAASATLSAEEWTFEAIVIATPCWHGGGKTRRLGWMYLLRLWSADPNGENVSERDWGLSEELGVALLRCEHPAAVALAMLPDPVKACAEIREEMGGLVQAAQVKSLIAPLVKRPAAGAKKPSASL